MMNANRITNNRKFNLTDFYYILHRSIKSSIVREWHSQLFKCLCLFTIAFYHIIIYPNDIRSNPLCTIHVIDDSKVIQIT